MNRTELLLGLDRERARTLHRAGKCCHDLTYPEVLDELGMSYEVIDHLQTLPQKLDGVKSVLLAECNAASIQGQLKEWVVRGGILIGCMTEGLDDLFGIRYEGYKVQPDDEFTINAYTTFYEAGWAPERRYCLPVISPVRIVRATTGRAVAGLQQPLSFNIFVQDSSEKNTFSDAMIIRPVGQGFCCYFASSIAHTLRAMHQGRPVDRDWDGDGMYRTADGIVLTYAHDLQDPLADDYLFILQGLFDRAGLISKHVYPPINGEISDCVFFYGGDDECDPTGVQQIAIEKMHDYNLPYHINIQCKDDLSGFAMSRELVEHMKSYGQESSIHPNFFRPCARFTREEFEEQLDCYEKHFGETPVVFVNHCIMFYGWTELARWASERGILGDNNKFPARMMPDANPINTFGFPFGTSYPVRVYDDAIHCDKALEYFSVPAILYEPRIYPETAERDKANLERHILDSAANGWFLPMFFHPVYIAQDENANAAIVEMLDIVKRHDLRVVHLGVDAVVLWWNDRLKSSIATDGAGKYTVDVKSDKGLVIRIPGNENAPVCVLDGKPVAMEKKSISGRCGWFLAVEQGVHKLEVQ